MLLLKSTCQCRGTSVALTTCAGHHSSQWPVSARHHSRRTHAGVAGRASTARDETTKAPTSTGEKQTCAAGNTPSQAALAKTEVQASIEWRAWSSSRRMAMPALPRCCGTNEWRNVNQRRCPCPTSTAPSTPNARMRLLSSMSLLFGGVRDQHTARAWRQSVRMHFDECRRVCIALRSISNLSSNRSTPSWQQRSPALDVAAAAAPCGAMRQMRRPWSSRTKWMAFLAAISFLFLLRQSCCRFETIDR